MSPTNNRVIVTEDSEEERRINSGATRSSSGGGTLITASSTTTYKEYGYSPLPVNTKIGTTTTTLVYQPTTTTTTDTGSLPSREDEEDKKYGEKTKVVKARADFELEMEESGSKVLQYVAAVAGSYKLPFLIIIIITKK